MQQAIDPNKVAIHELALIFLDMEPKQFEELVDNIKKHGIVHPVLMYEGKIVDGHHRIKAARILKIKEVQYEEWKGTYEELCSKLIIDNARRKHWTPSQLAVMGDRLAMLEHGTNRFSKVDAQHCATTQTEAAKQMNVSRRSVQQARKTREKAPSNIQKMVESGKLTVNAGAYVADLPDYQKKEIEKIKDAQRVKEEIKKIKEQRRALEIQEDLFENRIPILAPDGTTKDVSIKHIKSCVKNVDSLSTRLMYELGRLHNYLSIGISFAGPEVMGLSQGLLLLSSKLDKVMEVIK